MLLLNQDITGWGENDRGVSYTFGGDVVRQFLKKHDLSLIVRAHQVVEDGYQFFQKRKVSDEALRKETIFIILIEHHCSVWFSSFTVITVVTLSVATLLRISSFFTF